MDKWKEIDRRTVVQNRIFTLEERRAENPRNGQEVPLYVLDAADWVNVIPIDGDGKVITVRQYRAGTHSVTLEVPGGVIEPDESPEQGGRRELLEETGYRAGTMQLIGVVHPNPAIQSNATYTYLATDLELVADLDLDQAEDIDVELIDVDSMRERIRSGEVTHSLVVAAFYWLDQHRAMVDKVNELIETLASTQTDKVAAMAKRINKRLTADDLMNPQDFPELAQDPDFNYQDGYLAGVESVRAALKGLRSDQR